MNFGIMSSQTQLLIPGGIKPEELTAHLARFSYSDLIREIIKSGFRTIELSGDLVLLLPHYFSKESINELLFLKNQYNLRFTVHLPLWSVEPSTPLETVRSGSVDALVQHIQIMRQLEPEIYVLHATGALAAEFYRMDLLKLAKAYLLDLFKENAISSIRKIISESGLQTRKLAIETIEFPLDLTLEIAQELDLSICFDTGHILAGFSGDYDFFEALDLCIARIAEIHLHDCPHQEDSIGYSQDHRPLGHGDLDVGKFLNILDQEPFNGPVIFELAMAEATESIKYIQNLRSKSQAQ